MCLNYELVTIVEYPPYSKTQTNLNLKPLLFWQGTKCILSSSNLLAGGKRIQDYFSRLILFFTFIISFSFSLYGLGGEGGGGDRLKSRKIF